ncbi:hypothetical protein Pfo_022787 [Paulownia fortunei]|nr:hypothetical protein Pfo_022787 [Paulownia fortunei]
MHILCGLKIRAQYEPRGLTVASFDPIVASCGWVRVKPSVGHPYIIGWLAVAANGPKLLAEQCSVGQSPISSITTAATSAIAALWTYIVWFFNIHRWPLSPLKVSGGDAKPSQRRRPFCLWDLLDN